MAPEQIIFTILTVSSFGFFAFTAWRINKLFRLTKPADRFDRIGERIVVTLLVAFGQSKILKRPVSGLLHALVYWGFLVITIGSLEMMIDGVTGSHRSLAFLGKFYDVVMASGDVFAALIILSCLVFLVRRYITKPKRFTAPEMKPSSRLDATLILAMILILMVTLIGMNTAYIAQHPEGYAGSYPVSKHLTELFAGSSTETLASMEHTNWWIHISLIYFFLNVLPFSKHFHVISSVPNVFFSRLGPYSQLENMESVKREVTLMLDPNASAPPADHSAPVRFGVKDVEDVTWKTLLDSYTCTECGRCTSSCPANSTGKKLSPRKLFIDLRARMRDKGKGLISKGKEFSDGKSLVGDYISEEELWACTTCMACIEECPVDIDHVPFIIDMRRSLVMEESKAPQGLTMMFSNIENNGAPWQFSPADRFNWALDIETKKLL